MKKRSQTENELSDFYGSLLLFARGSCISMSVPPIATHVRRTPVDARGIIGWERMAGELSALAKTAQSIYVKPSRCQVSALVGGIMQNGGAVAD